ncbi:GTPase HflX [Roseobacteraceae bacterium S113]
MKEHGEQLTRAWVLHPDIKSNQDRRAAEPALAEAVALAAALPSLEVVGETVVPLPRPHPGMLFGSGKIEELAALMKREEVDLCLIDGPVSPVQQRNLEKALKVKLLDRTGLILEIFSDRAATREGVLQVEMAALSYQRTRLVRAWTHLERQRGGLGFVGGPGETQIEADRRAIDDQLVRLRRQLDRVVKTRTLHREARAKVPYPIVALVGYTNAGKSTLFNRLTGAEVMAKDMLFATLDPTMRAVTLENGLDVILSDTVGFISDLPTELVASFRATLEEVLEAHVVVHVRDVSAEESDAQAENVESILTTLGLPEKTPRIEVWNKMDQLASDEQEATRTRATRRDEVVTLSAITGEGMADFLELIEGALDGGKELAHVSLGFDEGRKRAWLFQQGVVEDERQTEEGFTFAVRWTRKQAGFFAQL